MPFAQKLLLERSIIFNDSIMNNGKLSRSGIVRVSIFIVGFTMCGPAGMSHSYMTAQVLTLNKIFKVSNFTFLFINRKAFIKQGNTCTIITPVFQAFKSFDDHIAGLSLTYVGNNSTHTLFLFFC